MREQFLPSTRGEFLDIAGRMQAHALQHTHQIGVGINSLKPAGDQQALDDTNVFGAHLDPVKQPVPASHRDDPQGTLRQLIIMGFRTQVAY